MNYNHNINKNFNLILENNKDFINKIEMILKKIFISPEYKKIEEEQKKFQYIKLYYKKEFKENNEHLFELDIRKNTIYIKNMKHTQVLMKFEKNNIIWSFEILKDDKPEVKLKRIIYELEEYNGMFVFSENRSVFESYLGKHRDIELKTPEIEQDIVDLFYINYDIDLSILLGKGVKNIVSDSENIKLFNKLKI